MTAKSRTSTTKRTQAVGGVLDRNRRFAKVLDLVPDAVVSVDQRRTILFFNSAAEVLFGYLAEEVCGGPLDILLPPGLVAIHWEHVKACPAGYRCTIVGRRKDGAAFSAQASISQAELGTRVIFTVSLHPTHGPNSAEERLRSTLREKEVLLEEIHHRVKNNLQVVASLLGLQARSIRDVATRAKFGESRHRIQAMAILHEILYESPSLAEIDFADYLRRLAKFLARSHGTAGRIRMRVRLQPARCHRDVALPCGLILNELLSNAVKYAFPGEKSGDIRVELSREGAGLLRLSVEDNGIGFPSDVHWQTSPTLGLRLVRTLAQQIEAVIRTNGSSNGTFFSIIFKDGLALMEG